MTDWQPLARRLAADLAAQGHLSDPAWRAAFEQTPRHLFVPRFHRDDGGLVDSADPGQQREWLEAVYADTSLVTQLAPVPGTGLCWPTSSSTMPSLMARMLELLDVADRHRVLEVGTGTGYNTAVLCHRLTDRQVASIDIHPGLVQAARRRLAELGHRPRLAAGDGGCGLPDGAPYHRIIATCAVPAVPPAWITQLTTGGVIVTDLRGEIASSLTVLRKTGQDTVQGRFLASPGHFMWLRAEAGNPLREAGTYRSELNLDGATSRTTPLDPASLDNPDLRLVLQLLAPHIQTIYRTRRNSTDLLHIRATDGRWADIQTTPHGTGHHLTETGPHPIWATAEHAAEWWARHRQPTRTRLGLTASTDGHQRIWLDHPDGPTLTEPPAQPTRT
jgi:methyltransferase of ATP-grasp peptide maturase system